MGNLHQKKEFCGFTYSEDERKLEVLVEGFSFNLIENGNDLFDFANEMHNCVNSYASSIRKHECNILQMQDENRKSVACIEVRDKKLVQAKGVCNAPLEGRVKDAVKKWMDICELDEEENL